MSDEKLRELVKGMDITTIQWEAEPRTINLNFRWMIEMVANHPAVPIEADVPVIVYK